MSRSTNWRTPQAILIAGSLVLFISLGVRHGFGLFMQPLTGDTGWGRETFAFTIALQNLVWGIAQPFTGALADRIGAGKVAFVGALAYAAGLVLMGYPQGQTGFVLAGGVLVGLGLSGTAFSIMFGVIGRSAPPERRSLVLGIATAVGSFGQFVMLPVTFGLIEVVGWSRGFALLSLAALAIVPLSFVLLEKRDRSAVVTNAASGPTAGEALRLAIRNRGFWLLFLGFFVCGFQIVFISVHLPAYLADAGIGAGVATTVLALIGLTNVAGTYYAGLWGGRYRKPMMLGWIYLLRGVIIAGFVLLPVSSFSAYAFGALLGLLWLSTVPLTNGTVVTLFGVKNLSMLGGIVFLSHQIGAFLGGWLGGVLYDRFGSYDIAWGISIALSLVAALLNFPIRETPAAPARAAAVEARP
ncbi:MAG: MFS transporter [Bauldia sp.]|nr:MFS transporter [Bauldia sp.]